MEGFGGLGFNDVGSAVRRKRSNTSRRPRNESQLPLDCHDNVSSTPSEDVSKSDENNNGGSITRKKDIDLNLCSARASFSNILEAETVQDMDKGEGGGSEESDESSNDGSFRGSDEHRHRGIESKRSSKGAIAPANWKSSNKVGPFGVVSDCSENENKVKMVKLKVGDVTRTIQAKSSSDGASAVGPSSVKSSHISDTPQPRQKLILQEDSDDNPSLSSDKESGLRGVPRKDTSRSVAHVGKAEELVRKSKRVPKRRFLDAVDDEDDMEVRYLEKLKTSKVTSDYTAEYNEDEERKTRKERKISTVMKGSSIGPSVDLADYGIPKSGKDGKKSRVGSVSDDTDYVEEEEEPVSDGEPNTKIKKVRKEFVESSSYNKGMTVTTRQRALKTGKNVSSSLGASVIEFPNGLPPAPPKKQKEKPGALEQQIKKAEAAERRRMQVEKATRESEPEAEAIRKILGQDSSRKKREDKIKKRQEDMAQERVANAFILPPDSVRWVMGPSGSVVTFPNEMGLPAIFDSKPCRFQEAEDDCTEALNLDDRYIKACSRRATARKELGKLKESFEDAEFDLRLEPRNQEIKKQYTEAKSLYDKSNLQNVSGALKNAVQEMQKRGKSDTKVNGNRIQPVSSSTQITEITAVQDHTKGNTTNKKQEMKVSVQEVASRAASKAKVVAAEKNVTPPTTAYQFEVSWRGLSGDRALQASLLKV